MSYDQIAAKEIVKSKTKGIEYWKAIIIDNRRRKLKHKRTVRKSLRHMRIVGKSPRHIKVVKKSTRNRITLQKTQKKDR